MSSKTPYAEFHQSLPVLENQYEADIFLQDYLAAYLPEDQQRAVLPDLRRFGAVVVGEMLDWARDAERNEPRLTQFSATGERIDAIEVAAGWRELERVAAGEGLVAIGYAREQGEWSRLYQFAKLYLYTPSSAIYTCPLAMTDGAARLIEVHGDDFLRNGPFRALTARDPARFNTSGQWMTERTGGSDVSRSMTLARQEGGEYRLYGHKWFTSAVTADMAFTLAATEFPADGRAPLSLFYLPVRGEDGALNGIRVEALKDKLGTRALPTAQLELTGARARLMGDEGKGVRTISTLFNITRIYNTISAVSYMRRAFALADAYGAHREAFGHLLREQPLYRKNLRRLEIDWQGHTLLAFFLARLLGRDECGVASATERGLLRLLTPVAKLYTAKGAIHSASEHIEMFGGIGYLEDSGIPVLLRNAQVLSIWEGTTNVLSLDMLRAAQREDGLSSFFAFAEGMLQQLQQQAPVALHRGVADAVNTLQRFLDGLGDASPEPHADGIAFYLAETVIALLWLEFCVLCDRQDYQDALAYWLSHRLDPRRLQEAYALGLL